jgi:hypothetical protein
MQRLHGVEAGRWKTEASSPSAQGGSGAEVFHVTVKPSSLSVNGIETTEVRYIPAILALVYSGLNERWWQISSSDCCSLRFAYVLHKVPMGG